MFFYIYLFYILVLSLLTSTPFFSYCYDKWIVVTTIQYPTPALKKLASLPDWQLIVVGDKKTPQDWHLDNCIYLDVEKQKQLSYSIIPLLPWNHYSRKNIGYLYALEHGASLIYETDDDNLILNLTYLPENCILNSVTCQQDCFNIFAFFGHPNVWPRGYPLNKITTKNSYTLMKNAVNIPIQQGLANSDPDVDAIFRLTHSDEIIFNNNNPVSLSKGIMCPFNTQNTFFHRSAFWGLLIPITTSFRVCDIWRGYFVQRLLWDMNATLCFLPPTAVQYRNQHNLLHDFADEIDLYLKADDLIIALNTWHSHKPLFEQRMKSLIDFLIKKDFFKKEEKMLMKAWINDLKKLNYSMPQCSN